MPARATSRIASESTSCTAVANVSASSDADARAEAAHHRDLHRAREPGEHGERDRAAEVTRR